MSAAERLTVVGAPGHVPGDLAKLDPDGREPSLYGVVEAVQPVAHGRSRYTVRVPLGRQDELHARYLLRHGEHVL